MWRTAAVRAALTDYAGRSLRGLFAPLTPVRVPLGWAARDCDTPEDLARARRDWQAELIESDSAYSGCGKDFHLQRRKHRKSIRKEMTPGGYGANHPASQTVFRRGSKHRSIYFNGG